jgi:hypothetical protein
VVPRFNRDVAAVSPRQGCCTPDQPQQNGKSASVIKPADEIVFNADIGNANTGSASTLGRQLDQLNTPPTP